jgi:hypothetical protein
MRISFALRIGLLVASPFSFAGCSPEPTSPPADESSVVGGTILTTFDRLTLSRGERSSFHAVLVGAGGRIGSDGLTLVSRAASVAQVSAAKGRAQVVGIGAGRTWILVQGAAATDSVEVMVR